MAKAFTHKKDHQGEVQIVVSGPEGKDGVCSAYIHSNLNTRTGKHQVWCCSYILPPTDYQAWEFPVAGTWISSTAVSKLLSGIFGLAVLVVRLSLHTYLHNKM